MKSVRSIFRHSGRGSILAARSCLALSLAFGVITACRAAETNRPPAAVVFPKSVFVDDANGKDPFFPNRQRGVVPRPSPDPAPKEPDWKALQLRGITGVGDQRFALINNLTFAKGEEGEVKVKNGKIKIRVLEVKERSVIVQIDGRTDQKELLLPETLLPVE